MSADAGSYRILVTGSRDFSDAKVVWGALSEASDADHDLKRFVVIVHGACPTGADAYADSFAAFEGLDVERHPADWAKHGRAAGPVRNAEMVRAGAAACLAFLMPCTNPQCRQRGPHVSHGSANCAHLAEAAGIPVRRFTA